MIVLWGVRGRGRVGEEGAEGYLRPCFVMVVLRVYVYESIVEEYALKLALYVCEGRRGGVRRTRLGLGLAGWSGEKGGQKRTNKQGGWYNRGVREDGLKDEASLM